MNVVGKVGSLISQGVYSVATPFHPFGGAVDVIVVQQQDGSFRSTPWYVRFGKFQGVLKGAEKVVHITVNGVEADFHMYLDNSGEAYFAREVNPCKGIETNDDLKDSDDEVLQDEGNKKIGEFCRLDHSISDSAVAQLRNELDSTNPKRFERAEYDTRFYDFQDEQSLIEGSVNLSEYGSTRYEGLNGECFGEAQGSDSEVVLVSVDGHVLTAPVSASEQSAENVHLSTPQFHLGPGEEPDFCGNNEEFSSSDNVWAADYISKLNSAAAKDSSDTICSLNSDSTTLNHPEVYGNGVEHACQTEETPNLSNHVRDSEVSRQSDVEDASMHNKDDIFKSCLELSELGRYREDIISEDIVSPLEAQVSQDKPPFSLPDADETEEGAVGDSRNKDVLSSSCSPDLSNNNGSLVLLVEGETFEKEVRDTDHTGSNNSSIDSVSNDPEQKDEQFGTSAATEGINSSEQSPAPEDKSRKHEIMETATSGEEIETRASSGFEISLCGDELHAGMGRDAAAEVFEAHRISHEEYKNNAMSINSNANLIIRFGERYIPWEKAAPIVLGMAAFGLELDVEPQDAIPVEQNESSNPKNDDYTITSTSSGRRWRLWPIPFRRVKTLEHTHSNLSTEDDFVDTESTLQNSPVGSTAESSGKIESPRKQFIRTNVPNSEQISSLNLKDGQNKITFSFSTRVLGTQQVDAHIYLWKWNAKIVISDVDGTITKSDVLGQFMPLVGRDWTQSGVAKLFSAIKENGYQLLFLSARAIVQAYLTRSFLINLKQDGNALPNGPVVISPDGLFPSLYREVIRRAPHEFKIACLEDIKKLFPSDYNPFYAGFGNRDTDELSYRKIGIPKGKIFIINPKGEVAVSHCINVKSYTSLHTLVNDMFPPTSLVEQEDFNSWNFWKMPLPDIE
ncbi:Phosphatidate phosphatase PAH1 [Hibiscus syriacus]|uniref:phosphatidate phosphatase n=1 Tax=Hibiscus syriacus TaxID=106335 RepID=A0A6A3B7L2_HIBSY|nr:phosphatidate phosphatase PAH1-like [Hibiscus syriacus]XP_038990784.1 phosphatidate phosphatase PAH1-like [Hibiscus syriacus]XP_038990785.1 phosphatidate phosphatase PAH1-like [Hibiscus syriacus]XP_038990786.1 phosphatidate phosphatase PAH1-like [Hibiscus syriacus]KAE8713214.1 Phosphatidate phosphatase PAH1 [Hibiscus syriacus]